VTNQTAATRRKFFVKAGTALSIPLAAGASAMEPVLAGTVPPAALDHANSIRRLQQALAREIHDASGRASELFAAGKLPTSLAGVTRILPADFGEHDVVEIAADGLTARATLHCSVQTQVPIEGEGTLIEMARAQGEGFVRSASRQLLEMACVRQRGAWKIKTLTMRDA
jgi:hypothetical protein